MRRILLPTLVTGLNTLPDDQAHHVRDVLRMNAADTLELFTPTGQSAIATLDEVSAAQVTARVVEILQKRSAFRLTIASAVPKAARADWMIEKLSELGVWRYVPLMTARSVVHPEGKNKIERWERLAAESAKQSHRGDVMEIGSLVTLKRMVEGIEWAAGFLSTDPSAIPLTQYLGGGGEDHGQAGTLAHATLDGLTLLIGPEGGWTAEEEEMMRQRGLTALALGRTILRVETAAMSAAAVVATLLNT